MLKEKKVQIVDKLTRDLSQSSIVIATGYQGMLAKQMAELRSALAKAGIAYHVVKNTLVHRAADQAGKPQLKEIVQGPVALAFGYDDPVGTVRTIIQYVKSGSLPLEMKGGVLGDRLLLRDDLMQLANLPTREILVSKLVGQLQAPMRSLHDVLSFPLRGLLNVLQNRLQAISK